MAFCTLKYTSDREFRIPLGLGLPRFHCVFRYKHGIAHNVFTVYEPTKWVAEGQAAVGGEA